MTEQDRTKGLFKGSCLRDLSFTLAPVRSPPKSGVATNRVARERPKRRPGKTDLSQQASRPNGQQGGSGAQQSNDAPVPTTLRLVPSHRSPEVQYRRPKRPLAERIAEAGENLATLEDAADWEAYGLMVFGDGRLGPVQVGQRDIKPDNVIPIRRRSTSFEIETVRKQEERRGKR